MSRSARNRVDKTLSAVVAVTALMAGCVPTHHYVIKNVPNEVTLDDSDYHAFEYVSVKSVHEHLVVHGKIHHEHESCTSEGHVDVSVTRPDGETTYEAALPLRRQSRKVYGWAGAGFRAELPHALADGERVRLAFHEDHCNKDLLLDGGSLVRRGAG
jgi:hypothetical protein